MKVNEEKYEFDIPKDSRLMILFECMIESWKEFIEEETIKLMKEYSLTYYEAKLIVLTKLKNTDFGEL